MTSRAYAAVERVELLVIGGGPAGLATVRAYRAEGGAGRVVLLSGDTAAPYERPPLSKELLRGETQADQIAIEDPSFFSDHDIDVRLRARVAALEPGRHGVRLPDGSSLSYGVCVLATGATPQRLPVPGADDPRVLLLRSLDDAQRLVAAAVAGGSAVVVGSGFIGCEAASSLAARGLRVTMLTSENRPQEQRLGPEVSDRIAAWLREDGVELRTGVDIEEIEDARTVRMAGERSVSADLVLTAVGVRPAADLAAAAGLAVEDDRVLVDPGMRTSAPDVLAAGDVALAYNATADRRLVVQHWGEALEMGRIAGANAAGGDESWAQSPGFWSTIGGRTLKHVAWGDGFDEVRLQSYGGGFTAWYGQDGVTVGVLTHERDDDYERGRGLVELGAPLP